MAPNPHGMERDETMQRYMLLTSQQEALRRRLSLQIPTPTPMATSSPEPQSFSSSPTSLRPTYSNSWTPEPSSLAPSPSQVYPIPITPALDRRNSLEEAQGEDMQRLCEVNQQIKATLTELLNTESVRQNGDYRAWIQERLLDAEHEIRKQRRHSRTSVDGCEMAKSIAEHFP